MERINISEEKTFIGCWQLNDRKLCEDIINLFENNKKFHIKGVTGIGIDESVKKSIDMPVDPKNLNNDKFKVLKIYMNKLFECYQDYKTTWPFLNRSFPAIDIPTFNLQKYEEGGHFSNLHCEREGISTMHRVFAWMTYLNDVEDGGETSFEHFKLKIKPETGKTLIWPAEWTHAHKGEVLKSGLKYIVTGWMHFPFNFQVPQKV